MEKEKKKTQCKSTRDSMSYRLPLDVECHKKKSRGATTTTRWCSNKTKQ